MQYAGKSSKSELDNVYASVINTMSKANEDSKAEAIVKKIEEDSISITSGNVEVEYRVVNYNLYKQIVVTTTRRIPVPVNLSFIGFPDEIPIEVTSTADVQNGDEFIRNMDIAVDFVAYLDEKYELSDMINKNEIFKSIKEMNGKF